jgi:hypothetical protein
MRCCLIADDGTAPGGAGETRRRAIDKPGSRRL